MSTISDEERSASLYRQMAELQRKDNLIRSRIENNILKNLTDYSKYDYNLRHRIMDNDIIQALSKDNEYQIITRQIIQLESEYEELREVYPNFGEML